MRVKVTLSKEGKPPRTDLESSDEFVETTNAATGLAKSRKEKLLKKDEKEHHRRRGGGGSAPLQPRNRSD